MSSATSGSNGDGKEPYSNGNKSSKNGSGDISNGSSNIDETNDSSNSGRKTSSSSANSSPNFCSQTITLRAQKKMAGQLANKRAVKFFVDEISSRIFDNIFKLMRLYTGSKTHAQKIMKGVIKINIKLAILYVNDQLNDEELSLSADFREKFHAIAESCLRVRRPRSRVTVDHLVALFSDCRDIVLKIIARHLSDKSKARVGECSAFFMDRAFLVAIFSDSPEYKDVMDLVVNDIQELMDRGII